MRKKGRREEGEVGRKGREGLRRREGRREERREGGKRKGGREGREVGVREAEKGESLLLHFVMKSVNTASRKYVSPLGAISRSSAI